MTLLRSVRPLLLQGLDVYAGTPVEPVLRSALERLDGPLRVAIAGRVKAGKSTLLNALVGERLAPTDEGECTRIVTWYRHGITYRAHAQRTDGQRQQLPLHLEDGHVDVDLDGLSPQRIERLLVDWPSSSLRPLTLIDTPGISSLSPDVADRAWAFLTAEDRPAEADAVLYLMRHLHSADVRFLEAFHDDGVAHPTPVNAIGVLSRADEIGAGRPDALASAARIAARYRSDRQVWALCQTVMPVAGLLAESGATLTQSEHDALAALAGEPPEAVDEMLASVDRFASAAAPVTVTAGQRAALLRRLGLFGVRLSVGLLRERRVRTATQLSEALVSSSGIAELRRVLSTHFTRRADLLKARSALLTLRRVLASSQPAGASQLDSAVERVEAGAHELAELRLLNALRAGAVALRDDETEAAERLLGARGDGPVERLDLPPTASGDDLRAAVAEALGRWQRRAESPLSSRSAADAARVLVRTCEGLLASLASADEGARK